MFRKILIANRGEIACRVIETARAMGIGTVAVYSEADRDAPHVREADEARCVGPAPASQSYLKFEAIVSIAKETGAEAIHPGYGFLAENADFAEACAAAGIVFIGPPPEAIRAMGDKAAAKAIMEKAGVPVVPGYHGKDQKPAKLLEAAKRIGFPVLLKASAGGGGKGMRMVADEASFADALAGAGREAKSAFGDDRMLVEKFVERPRHIEVQVFADGHGHALHMFERDCSVQRRHQKVVEEAPAPGVDADWRARICEAAVAAARAVDYRGAGTVEFIVASGPDGVPGEFWFMEMNTRLQVEHPVTELVTGLDLVELQLRVAADEPLPIAQQDILLDGHAMEVRLYAEDPARGFLPAPGRVCYLSLPWDDPAVRIDQGIPDEGAVVPADYDPMIAKLSVQGADRAEALRRMRAALDDVRIAGLASNAPFLARILDHPEFVAGGVDTGFVERNIDALVPAAGAPPDADLALAVLALLRRQAEAAVAAARASGDPWSPWAQTDGWRLNDVGHTVLRLIDGGEEIDVLCRPAGDGWRLDLPGGTVAARLAGGRVVTGRDGLLAFEDMRIETGDRQITGTAVIDGDALHLFRGGAQRSLRIYDPLAAASAHEGLGGGLTAPMPGKVTALHVEAGQAVARGQALVVVEAMKMEHTLHAPADGRVAEIRFQPGDQVQEGDVLVVVEEQEG